jgi:ATP-binding cassette subfamily B protein
MLDRILVFDRGEVVEEGRHEELVRKSGGIYRRLFERQALGLLSGEEDDLLDDVDDFREEAVGD